MLNPIPKQTTYRSAAYRKFVASKPCCICGTPHLIAAHHAATGSMGKKAGDEYCVPTCFECHFQLHQQGRKDAIPGLDNIIKRLRAEWEQTNGKP